MGKKIINATHQRKKASVRGGISSLTARPITKLPPHKRVASTNNIWWNFQDALTPLLIE